MLKRIHIKGYKSLGDVEVHLSPLAVLFGPMRLERAISSMPCSFLSKLATSKTLKEAFEPPYRGKP